MLNFLGPFWTTPTQETPLETPMTAPNPTEDLQTLSEWKAGPRKWQVEHGKLCFQLAEKASEFDQSIYVHLHQSFSRGLRLLAEQLDESNPKAMETYELIKKAHNAGLNRFQEGWPGDPGRINELYLNLTEQLAKAERYLAPSESVKTETVGKGTDFTARALVSKENGTPIPLTAFCDLSLSYDLEKFGEEPSFTASPPSPLNKGAFDSFLPDDFAKLFSQSPEEELTARFERLTLERPSNTCQMSHIFLTQPKVYRVKRATSEQEIEIDPDFQQEIRRMNLERQIREQPLSSHERRRSFELDAPPLQRTSSDKDLELRPEVAKEFQNAKLERQKEKKGKEELQKSHENEGQRKAKKRRHRHIEPPKKQENELEKRLASRRASVDQHVLQTSPKKESAPLPNLSHPVVVPPNKTPKKPRESWRGTGAQLSKDQVLNFFPHLRKPPKQPLPNTTKDGRIIRKFRIDETGNGVSKSDVGGEGAPALTRSISLDSALLLKAHMVQMSEKAEKEQRKIEQKRYSKTLEERKTVEELISLANKAITSWEGKEDSEKQSMRPRMYLEELRQILSKVQSRIKELQKLEDAYAKLESARKALAKSEKRQPMIKSKSKEKQKEVSQKELQAKVDQCQLGVQALRESIQEEVDYVTPNFIMGKGRIETMMHEKQDRNFLKMNILRRRPGKSSKHTKKEDMDDIFSTKDRRDESKPVPADSKMDID